MDLNLIIALISLIFGVISIIIGILIAARFAGKLKTAIIFLIVAVAFFIIEESIEILNFLAITNLRTVKNIVLVGIILFILLAIISMKQMVSCIDNHPNHQKSSQKKIKRKI